MMRMIVLSAAAALALAAPAHAGSIRVPVAGKSTAQIQADVTKAAKSVCFRETRSETLALDAYKRCVRSTTATAMDQLAAAKSETTLAAR